MLGLPAAVSLSAHEDEVTFDKVPYPVACRQLEEAGAAVVGLNCARGPRQTLRIMKEIRRACKVSTDFTAHWFRHMPSGAIIDRVLQVCCDFCCLLILLFMTALLF